MTDAHRDRCSVVSYLNESRTTRPWIALLSAWGALSCAGVACGEASSTAPEMDSEASAETKADEPKSTSGDKSGTSGGGTTIGTAGSSSGQGSSSGDARGSSTGTTAGTEGSGSTTGGAACTKTVVLMGYWPPTNEMLRPFSTDPVQNPGGWVGENWRGLGFDVYAFFPEFPPDGDPTNDPIGSPGSVGADGSDLQVDYQDTSSDFWSIVDTVQPHVLITHSRGGGIGWELEAIEGGHGNGSADPAFDWISDGYGPDTRPTEDTVDPRSWAAMNTYRDTNADSLLPLEAIETAAAGLGLTSVEVDVSGTSGNYLSGFLGLHGIVYAETTPHAVAGGHIHVGTAVSVEDARALTDASLEAVLQTYPARSLGCPKSR